MSNALFYLNDKDFHLKETSPGALNLCVKFEGYSLLLFYSNNCEHSAKLLPVFKQLPEIIGGCTIGLVNVDNNKKIIEDSKKTNVPITYVPLIVLYTTTGPGSHSLPFMRYDGVYEKVAIKNFVIDIANKLSKQKSSQREIKQTPQQKKQEEVENSIPKYTIGVPKNSKSKKNKGYGNFDSAYKSGDGKQKNGNPSVAKFNQDRFG
jgi:hypothetical protein